MKQFDRKFGSEYLQTVPLQSGVYTIFNEAGEIIYIGKAKNLRRRLSQYRNAKRVKRHHKMRGIVAEASRIELNVLPTELDASLTELEMIQRHRPRWNVSGAYCFLYPYWGIDRKKEALQFCFTTTPDVWSQMPLYGAFRSREVSGDGFFSLMEVLKFLGHREPRREKAPKHSYLFGYRRLPRFVDEQIEDFLRGRSREFLESLSMALLEKAAARAMAVEVQKALRSIRRFWNCEIAPLERALSTTEATNYPLKQNERDPLFIRYRARLLTQPNCKSITE